MGKVIVKEDTLYYKSMTLESESLVVSVKEKQDYRYKNSEGELVGSIEPACVEIYHSPGKFDQERFRVSLKNRASLKEYIAMLQDFDRRFGDLLDVVQSPEEKDGE